jgi:hypothetical protein
MGTLTKVLHWLVQQVAAELILAAIWPKMASYKAVATSLTAQTPNGGTVTLECDIPPSYWKTKCAL